MPTFKHPCPHCAKFIARDVAACPFCGTADPFAPARCPNCRAVIEERAWVSCPKCGTTLARPAADTAAAQAPAGAVAAAPQPAAGAQSGATKCSGCGAPLPANARFCTVCGTLAS